MKKFAIKSLAFVLAAGALMTTQGCRRDANTPLEPSNSPIEFDVQIESGAPVKAAAIKDAFVLNDKFGMWVVPYIKVGTPDVIGTLRAVGNYVDNAEYTHNGTNFVTSKGVFYPSAISKVDLYAVSPYNAAMSAEAGNTMTDPAAFAVTVAPNQTTALAVVGSDFMSAYVSGAKQGSLPKLAFSHRMSKVVISFTVPALYKTKTVTAVKDVMLCDIQLKSTVNVRDTAAAPVIVAADNAKLNVLAYQATAPAVGVNGNYTYEAIVTPGVSVAAQSTILRLTLTVDGIGDVIFDCKVPTVLTYKAKQQTSIKVNIEDQTAITLSASDVVITGWTKTDISGSTSKKSRMIFDVVTAGRAADITGVSATLTIQGEEFEAKAAYAATDAATGKYTLEFDHKSNANGYLEAITMRDDKGVSIFNGAAVIAGGKLQIKGDPTLDSYNTIIGKMTFDAAGIVTITKN